MSQDMLIRELRAIVGDTYLLLEKEDVIVYEQDGSIFQAMPEVVVVPGNVEQVAAVVKAAKASQCPDCSARLRDRACRRRRACGRRHHRFVGPSQ